ncbi:hypothetical protein NBRC116601_17160 [Cognatishimia sp. WU-CL00825]|uniref:cobalamin biosynthesis protein CobQ n=1 Tax=Cognatishimia sp. WU-CL00825 TaxID=3127658 RepID=UPI00310B524E
MNTPAHILFGWAVLARGAHARLSRVAILGAVFPDLSLYLLASVSLFVLQIEPNVVFGELYFSPLWQGIFAVDNSFVVWTALFLLAYFRSSQVGMIFTAAALLHLAFDFPLHHDDGRAHFWPLTNWVFESPVSYWDHQHYAQWVAPLEALAALACGLALYQGFTFRPQHIVVTLLLVLELIAVLPGFLFMFP